MTAFTIIGSGNMAQAIGGVLLAGGYAVELHVRAGASPREIDPRLTVAELGSAPAGEIVILAVPFGAFDELIAQYGELLSGKILVDITNPLDFSTFDSLVVTPGTSAAEILAERVPGAVVLKAFNTTFGATLASGRVGEVVTAVQIAGDDEAAKELLAAAVRGGGLRAIDAGPLRRAQQLEQLGFLQLTLAAREQISWTGGFAVVA